MQLDGAPEPDSTGSDPHTPGDLEADQKDLASVGDAAYKLWDKLFKHGTDAQFATYQAALALEDDFSIGGALRDVGDYWFEHVTSVSDACGHISNHLDYTKNAHAGDEHYVVTLLGVKELSAGFDDRSGEAGAK
ncbi:hypothetical protein SAMN05421870_101532 [Streptomyces qinglanensis]|uniref:Uncharacterized protein n=2 Tax=Streptomyces qinglanensis TaxID=943816 RepID=A0A1H9NQ08_9ACTN|nr:hypothetical protein SAMN05421870_101532 [Streptomyces qinglanensis]